MVDVILCTPEAGLVVIAEQNGAKMWLFSVGLFLATLGTAACASAGEKPRAGLELGFTPWATFPFTLVLEISRDLMP